MRCGKKLYTRLARRGPYRVLRGDLRFAGLRGVVFTPESGRDLTAIAFGHDWLTGAAHYAGLLEHLATWGIVAAAPDTERGPLPSVGALSADLCRTIDIITGARLGGGRVSVDDDKLGLVGHGFGGSAAVFAAARRPVRAAVAIFPRPTTPPAEQQAADMTTPGMILCAPDSPKALRSNAIELAHAWHGATLRMVSKAKAGGLPEGRRLAGAFGLPASDRRTQQRVRALLTGYLLMQAGNDGKGGRKGGMDKAYRVFADPAAQLHWTMPLTGLPEPAGVGEKIAALLR